VAGFCEHGNEPSGSIKGGEFLDQLNEYWLLKKDSAPWCYSSSTFSELIYQLSTVRMMIHEYEAIVG
jgi:hypothetical protein